MKKKLQQCGKIVFSLLLIVSIFATIRVLAGTSVFQIINIEVIDKSDHTIVNEVSLNRDGITNDILFRDKDDYITYNITFVNNSDEAQRITAITNNNISDYLEYTYDDIVGVELAPGEEKDFGLTIRYKEETTNLVITDSSISFAVAYVDRYGNTSEDTIGEVKGEEEVNDGTSSTTSNNNKTNNPKTNDAIIKYIILSIISLIGLSISCVNRKNLGKSLAAITAVSAIVLPIGAKAANDSFIILFNVNKIDNYYSELIPGFDFHEKIMKDNSTCDTGYEYEIDDSNGLKYIACLSDWGYMETVNNGTVKHIIYASDEEYEEVKDSLTDDDLISTDKSNVPAYRWYNTSGDTLYIYSPAKYISLNEDSSYLFEGMYGLEDIDSIRFDTSNVVSMKAMFSYDYNLTSVDFSNFDTSNVTDISYMFYYIYKNLNLNLNNFDTHNVTNMKAVFFDNFSVETIDVSEWDTSNVTDMSYMFADCQHVKRLDLSKWDTSKVTDMTSMFDYTQSIEYLDVSNFNTSNVTSMNRMFMWCTAPTIDVSNFNTSKVTDMSYMFSTTSTTVLDVSNFDTSNVTDMTYMFGGASSVTNLDMSNFDTHNVENMYGMFHGMRKVENLDVSNFNTSKVKDMSYMFGRTGVTSLDLSSFDTSNVENMNDMFVNMEHIETLDLSSFDTSNVTNMAGMFEMQNTVTYKEDGRYITYIPSSSLTSITLGNKFNTENVTDMSLMFANLNSLRSLDLSNFNTSNVTTMDSMFRGLTNLGVLDLSSFDTSNVTDMDYMFFRSSGIYSLNTSSFNTSNVTKMRSMFDGCNGLTSLDLTNFDTSKVTDMAYMFSAKSLRDLDISSFNTANVTTMVGMFQNTDGLITLDLSNFDFKSNVNFEDMFSGSDVVTIYVSSDLPAGSKSSNMFWRTNKLVGGAGTVYDESKVTSAYARIDDPTNNRPGYLTYKERA